MAFKSSNVSISTQCFTRAWLSLYCHGYTRNGQSDKPWTGYTYDRLADDIAIVLEALQVENATLVGFSVGGALSIRYMSRYNGRRISKLALIDAVSPLSLKSRVLTVYRKNKQMLSLIKCMLIYQNF